MYQLWDRTRDRIDYNARVLLSIDDGDPIEGRALNLSERGIFVSTERTCTIGTELTCELPVNDDALTVRGRVAWICDDRLTNPGMGIEFYDLSQPSLDQLKDAVGPSSPTQPVSVWFEGMDTPIKAEAYPSRNGITLRTMLPFLRVSSPVVFEMDGERSEARLRAVSISTTTHHAVPRLQVRLESAPEGVDTLDLTQPEAEPEVTFGPADDTETPVPLVQAKRRSTLDVADSQIEDELAETASEAESDADQAESPKPIDQPEQLNLLAEPGSLDHAMAAATTDAPIDAPAAEWSFGEEDPSEQNDAFWNRASPPRSRLWLWCAAIAMSAIAIVSSVETGLWPRVAAWILADQAKAPSFSANEQADAPAVVTTEAPEMAKPAPVQPKVAAKRPAPATAKPTATKPTATKPTATKPTATKAAAKPKVAAAVVPAQADGKDRVHPAMFLHNGAGSVTLRIPFTGTKKGAINYVLANPDGLVIKLPEAQVPVVASGRYRLRNKLLRSLWVRPFNKRGVRIRALFRGKQSHRLELTDSEIIVHVKPVSGA